MSQKKLSAVITIGGGVTATLKTALGSTSKQLQAIGKDIGALTKRQKLLGESINVFGRMGKDVDGLRLKYAQATTELDRMRRAFERLGSAQKRSDAIAGAGRKAMGVGAGMTAAGAVTIAPIVIGGKEAAKYQTETARISALGLGDQVTKDAEKFARAMHTVGTSKLENLTMVRDALSVFGDLHHAELAAPIMARMKFGNEAFYGAEHGAENESKFLDMLKVIELRGGTKSQAAFSAQANMVQKVLTATGGRVGPEEWRHLIATGGLAAKGMRDDAFYYQLEPLVQEMGGDRVGTGLMSSYSSLYQGRTTKRALQNLGKLGLIGDKSKVKTDRVGQMAFMDVGAIKGAELFRQSQYEWMKQILLPTLAKKGLTTKDQVLDAIGSIFSNRKGADLMGAMYLQMQQIDKNERMNRGAYDIDQLNKAGADTALGRQLIAEKKLEDLKLAMGQKVLPMYTAALELANSALDKMNVFMEHNPTLAKAVVVGVASIGAGLLVLGPIVTAAGGALVAYASYQMLVARRAAMMEAAVAKSGVAAEASAGKFSAASSALGGFMKRLLIANLGDSAAGMFGLGGKKIDQAQDDLNWSKATAWEKYNPLGSGVARVIEKTGNAIGLTNLANQAQADRIKSETEYLRKQGRLPDVPPMASQGQGTTVNDNSQYTINIQQQPGEDIRAFAERLQRELKRRQDIDSRSSMTDGVGAQ